MISDTVRRVVRSYLIQQDFDVCGEAVDGEDAVEKARKLKPDLILLDSVWSMKRYVRSLSTASRPD
jgi:chemotaxis response regulator CheB